MTLSDNINFLLSGFRKETRASWSRGAVKYIGWVMALFTVVAGVLLKFESDVLQYAALSINWPKVNGVITHSSVESHTDNRDTTYSANIEYDYNIAGKHYHSSNISLAGWANRCVIEQKHYDALVRKFPERARVMVFYNPSNPNESILQPGVVVDSVLSPAMFLLCATLFAGSAIWLGSWFSQSGNYTAATALVTVCAVIASSVLTFTVALVGTKAFVQMVVPKEALVQE